MKPCRDVPRREFVTYSSDQLLRAEFSAMLRKQDEQKIFDLIGSLINTMGSKKLALDG
jgi:hypothetical protein